MSGPFDFYPGQARPPRNQTPWGLLIFLALLAAAVGVGYGVWRHYGSPPPPGIDPYPECADIRAWLRDNTGDPSRLEVIRRGRGEAHAGASRAIIFRIEVRYRELNKLGAPEVFCRGFVYDLNGRRVLVEPPGHCDP